MHNLHSIMNEKAKILFFCMIFVGGGVFAQKNSIDSSFYKGRPTAFCQLNTPHFCRLSLVKAGNNFFIGVPVKKEVTPGIYSASVLPVIAGNFYTQNFGFFCKKELQVEKVTKIPFKFRIGSVQQCDWMEGKPNAGLQSF